LDIVKSAAQKRVDALLKPDRRGEGRPVGRAQALGIEPGQDLVVREVVVPVLGALLSDPSRCEEMGQRGRRFVEEAFNPGVVAARMTDAYEAAMRSGGSKADLAPAGVRP